MFQPSQVDGAGFPQHSAVHPMPPGAPFVQRNVIPHSGDLLMLDAQKSFVHVAWKADDGLLEDGQWWIDGWMDR